MATYVNDLRLKEIGTGESSGTWGTETNTNLELIGEALGFGTEAITTNADTHTTTVADGSTDPGRAMYLKYTGTLDSACTITIAPNTISRMQFIENGTSGSQNIIISQGTGANVTIPAGDTKAVYLDGAGSGAAVVDAFASLNTVDLKVEDDLTVTDDASVGGDLLVSGEVQTANIGFTDGDNAVTISDGGSTSFAQELTATAGVKLTGTTPTLTIGDAGAEDTKIVFDGNAQDFYIALDDSADDLLVGLGSTVGTTPIISITEAGAVTLKNVGTGDDNPMSLTLQTSETDIAADDVLGKISFQAPDEGTGTDAILVAAAIQAISEGDFSSSSNATSLAFMTGASEAATSKMTLSSGGDLSLLIAGKRLYIPRASDAAATGSLYSPSDSDIRLSGAGSSAGELQFEPSSGSGVAMTIDSSGNVGIGDTTPDALLHIATASGDCTVLIEAQENSSSREPHLQLKGTNTSSNPIIEFGDSAGFPGTIEYENSDNSMRFGTNAAEAMRVTSAQKFVVGDTAALNGGGALGSFVFSGSQGVFISTVAQATGEVMGFVHQKTSVVGTIAINSSSTAYNTSSDARLKDVTGEARGLDVINKLNPVSYNWKVDGKADEGLIAQECEDIVPNAITKNSSDYYGMDYSKLVVHLVKGMQEQQEQIEQLKTEIKTLQ